jgi:hypothetical protein
MSPFSVYVGGLGYYFDSDFSNYWIRCREYDPSVGRFLSIDPLSVLSNDEGSVFSQLGQMLDVVERQSSDLKSRALRQASVNSMPSDVTYDALNFRILSTSRPWVFRSIPARNGTSRTGSSWMPTFGNPYAYAANNPSGLVDPSGLQPSAQCLRALADLNSAIKGGQRRFQNNLKNPIDPGHFKAKSQIIVRITNALARVLRHCGCSLVQAVVQQAQNLIDQIKQQLDALNRAITSQNLLSALAILLTIIALLVLLLAIVGGVVVLA